MDGSGTDDERLRIPYLTANPSTLDNGSLFTKSTGLYAYYNGSVHGPFGIGTGGDEWGDVVDADIIPDGTNTRDLGNTSYRFAEAWITDAYIDKINGLPDTEHYIDMDYLTDTMAIHAYDTAGGRLITIKGGSSSSYPIVNPQNDREGYLGQSTYEWYRVYGALVYSNLVAQDEVDDLAIIDGMQVLKDETQEIVRDEFGNPRVDVKTVPDWMRADLNDPLYYDSGSQELTTEQIDEKLKTKSHVDIAGATSLAIGGVKQLHGKHKALETSLLDIISQLEARIAALEAA
jgi:hypothetical protein